MNRLTIAPFFFVTAIVLTNAYPAIVKVIGPSENGVILQGPATKTVIKGPDGSVISTVANAGSVVSPGHQAGVIISRVKPVHVANSDHQAAAIAPTHVTLPVIYAGPLHGYGHGFNAVLVQQPHA